MGRRHDIRLHGPAVREDRISGPVLSDLLFVVVEGTQRAVRLHVDGRSTVRGSQPAWLRAASQFDLVTGVNEPGLLRIDSRPLSELLPEQVLSRSVFGKENHQKTGLDLFEEGLEDALAGSADSERFDEGLVETFAHLARLFEYGLEAVEIVNGRTIPVRREGVERVQQLRRQTPPPQAVRVAGTLDAIRHSDRMFTLVLASGGALKGYAERIDPVHLASLFGKNAVVSGTAVFRPSGTALRIDADSIEATGAEQLHLWAKMPKPVLPPIDLRALREPQNPRTGINAVIGQWPGDETDEELRVALEYL